MTLTLTDERWHSLLACSNEFTCYSAAVATWSAAVEEDWGRKVNAGLWLALTEEPDGLFGFGYFRPETRAELGLVRQGADDSAVAIDAVLGELARTGRVIIAGDGYRLPWHVAADRVNAPHWFVLLEGRDGLEVADPFACRNELGVQKPARRRVERDSLETLLEALPGDNPVHVLREVLALGDETRSAVGYRYQWLMAGEPAQWHPPDGARGPAALERLARHFRERGQDPAGYSQVDDIWSIARHRAFLTRRVADAAEHRPDADLASWVVEHAEPLVRRWNHIAPLLMQARLAISAGRPVSSSVPDTLEELAGREQEAAAAFPTELDAGSI
jgi:hypothetical protein